MGGFEYRQAAEIRDCFTRHGVRYLFIGKSGAILLGFPDTTQDADLFVEKTPANGERLVAALLDLEGKRCLPPNLGKIANYLDLVAGTFYPETVPRNAPHPCDGDFFASTQTATAAVLAIDDGVPPPRTITSQDSAAVIAGPHVRVSLARRSVPAVSPVHRSRLLQDAGQALAGGPRG